MPAGEAPVLCSRSRDSCRLALVVLPPAMPLAGPPAGAFGPPASESSGAIAAPAGSAASATQLPASAAPTDAAAAKTPAAQQQPAPPPPQQQQPISEIVSLEVADSLGAGAGAVIFVHPELAELEALAQRLEKDETAALHGALQLDNLFQHWGPDVGASCWLCNALLACTLHRTISGPFLQGPSCPWLRPSDSIH